MTLPSPDTWFKTLAVWSRAHHLSVTEALQNIKYLRLSGEVTVCSFETWRPEWGSNPRSPTFQADSFNHCFRAPAAAQTNGLDEKDILRLFRISCVIHMACEHCHRLLHGSFWHGGGSLLRPPPILVVENAQICRLDWRAASSVSRTLHK